MSEQIRNKDLDWLLSVADPQLITPVEVDGYLTAIMLTPTGQGDNLDTLLGLSTDPEDEQTALAALADLKRDLKSGIEAGKWAPRFQPKHESDCNFWLQAFQKGIAHSKDHWDPIVERPKQFGIPRWLVNADAIHARPDAPNCHADLVDLIPKLRLIWLSNPSNRSLVSMEDADDNDEEDWRNYLRRESRPERKAEQKSVGLLWIVGLSAASLLGLVAVVYLVLASLQLSDKRSLAANLAPAEGAAEASNIAERLARLEASFEAARAENEALNEQLEQAVEARGELESELEEVAPEGERSAELQAELAAAQAALAEKRAAFEAERAALQTALSEAEQQQATLSAEITRLQALLEAQESELARPEAQSQPEPQTEAERSPELAEAEAGVEAETPAPTEPELSESQAIALRDLLARANLDPALSDEIHAAIGDGQTTRAAIEGLIERPSPSLLIGLCRIYPLNCG